MGFSGHFWDKYSDHPWCEGQYGSSLLTILNLMLPAPEILCILPTLITTSLSQKHTHTHKWHASLLFNIWLFIILLHLILRSQIRICISGIISINCKALYKHKQASLLPLWSLASSLFITICHFASSLSLQITNFPPNTSLVLVDSHCLVPEYRKASVNVFSSSMNCLPPISHKKGPSALTCFTERKEKLHSLCLKHFNSIQYSLNENTTGININKESKAE